MSDCSATIHLSNVSDADLTWLALVLAGEVAEAANRNPTNEDLADPQ